MALGVQGSGCSPTTHFSSARVPVLVKAYGGHVSSLPVQPYSMELFELNLMLALMKETSFVRVLKDLIFLFLTMVQFT